MTFKYKTSGEQRALWPLSAMKVILLTGKMLTFFLQQRCFTRWQQEVSLSKLLTPSGMIWAHNCLRKVNLTNFSKQKKKTEYQRCQTILKIYLANCLLGMLRTVLNVSKCSTTSGSRVRPLTDTMWWALCASKKAKKLTRAHKRQSISSPTFGPKY